MKTILLTSGQSPDTYYGYVIPVPAIEYEERITAAFVAAMYFHLINQNENAKLAINTAIFIKNSTGRRYWQLLVNNTLNKIRKMK